MKKMNNKGFSLVELIIVIAIMAVLVGVLAPQFLRYVEQSRIQKDESAMGEVCNATKIACSIEKVYDEISGSATVSFGGGSLSCSGSELAAELSRTIPQPPTFASKRYKGQTATVTITIDSQGSVTATTACTGLTASIN